MNDPGKKKTPSGHIQNPNLKIAFARVKEIVTQDLHLPDLQELKYRLIDNIFKNRSIKSLDPIFSGRDGPNREAMLVECAQYIHEKRLSLGRTSGSFEDLRNELIGLYSAQINKQDQVAPGPKMNFGGHETFRTLSFESDVREIRVRHSKASRLVSPEICAIFLEDSQISIESIQKKPQTFSWINHLADQLPHIDIFEVLLPGLGNEMSWTSRSIKEAASTIAAELLQVLESKTMARRKIVLVAHSLAAIVVKELISSIPADRRSDSFLDKISGILFLSPIHYFSMLESYANNISTYLPANVLASILEENCRYISELDERAANILSRSNIGIVNIFDDLGLTGIGTAQIDKTIIIQSETPTNVISRSTTHHDIAQPKSASSVPCFQLELLIEGAERNRQNSHGVFLHMVDHHFLKWHNFGRNDAFDRRILNEIEQCCRITFALFDRAYVPASIIFHLPTVGKALHDLSSSCPEKLLAFGEGWSVEDYAQTARERYRHDDPSRRLYDIKDWHLDFAFMGRQRSATQEVVNRWNRFGPDALLANSRRYVDRSTAVLIEANWESAPRNLVGLAFMADYIAPELGLSNSSGALLHRSIQVLTSDYFIESVAAEFNALIFGDLAVLSRPVNLMNPRRTLPFRAIKTQISQSDLLRGILSCPINELGELLSRDSITEGLHFVRERSVSPSW